MSVRVCKHEGCPRIMRGAGYCSTHYKRARAGISLDLPIAEPISTADRFKSKLRATPSGCVEWTAGTNGAGYGMFFVRWDAGKNVKVLAHRWSYEQANGPIPDGLHLDHLCRNTLCVNPDHLEAVTQRVNTLRGIGVAAIHAAKTECVNGHPFSGDNLKFRSNGRWRDCRECHREKDRRLSDRKKAK